MEDGPGDENLEDRSTASEVKHENTPGIPYYDSALREEETLVDIVSGRLMRDVW